MKLRYLAIVLALAGCVTISGAETINMRVPIEPPHSIGYDLDDFNMTMRITTLGVNGQPTGAQDISFNVRTAPPAFKTEAVKFAKLMLQLEGRISVQLGNETN